MRRQTAGFTLIEGLLALALFLMALAILGSLLSDFSTFQRRFLRGDGDVVSAPEILSRVSAEVWEASEILRPSSSASETVIELSKAPSEVLDERQSRPYPSGLYWDPDSVPLEVVSYSLDSSDLQLVRTNGGESVRLGGNITSLTASRTYEGEFVEVEVTLVVKDGNAQRDWRTRVVKIDAW